MPFDPTSLVEHIGAASIVGLVGLTFFANMVPGIPEELFMIFVGVTAGLGVIDLWWALVIIIPCLLVSDHLLYTAARRGNKAIYFIKDKIFPRLDIENQFIKIHLIKIVIISKFIFQVRFLSPFLAGFYKMSRRKFFIIDLITVSAYVGMMTLIGYSFHDSVEKLMRGIGVAKNIVILVIIFLVLVLVFRFVKKRFLSKVHGTLPNPLARFGITRDDGGDTT